MDDNKLSKLQDAMSRASKLIQMESNGTLDKIAKGHVNEINESLNDGSNLTTAKMMGVQKNMTAPFPNGTQMGSAADKIPSVIKESFMKNPINNTQDVSFLTNNLMTENKIAKTQVSKEEAPTQYMQQQYPQQIDYPMIRTIVEEIVRKYTSALNKKIINEGKQSGGELNTLTIGKTFKFLDSKGNIYEAQLKKIGNINEKRATN